jgi:hypothetical protein
MLTQLQAMIDSLAVQATPVVRDVAAKAAELASIAAEKAGPLAHRAAEATERVGGRVAARSKEMAADLRRSQAEEQGADPSAAGADTWSDPTAGPEASSDAYGSGEPGAPADEVRRDEA